VHALAALLAQQAAVFLHDVELSEGQVLVLDEVPTTFFVGIAQEVVDGHGSPGDLERDVGIG